MLFGTAGARSNARSTAASARLWHVNDVRPFNEPLSRIAQRNEPLSHLHADQTATGRIVLDWNVSQGERSHNAANYSSDAAPRS